MLKGDPGLTCPQDMEKLPATLQFPPPTKQREKDPVLRMMCIEILLLLSSSALKLPFQNKLMACSLYRQRSTAPARGLHRRQRAAQGGDRSSCELLKYRSWRPSDSRRSKMQSSV